MRREHCEGDGEKRSSMEKLTMRDFFAAFAMNALIIQNPEDAEDLGSGKGDDAKDILQSISALSYEFANSILAERAARRAEWARQAKAGQTEDDDEAKGNR